MGPSRAASSVAAATTPVLATPSASATVSESVFQSAVFVYGCVFVYVCVFVYRDLPAQRQEASNHDPDGDQYEHAVQERREQQLSAQVTRARPRRLGCVVGEQQAGAASGSSSSGAATTTSPTSSSAAGAMQTGLAPSLCPCVVAAHCPLD
ncbi:hypothetical protein MY11210_008684 [Beauveria gryllotalpidicola]